MIFISSLWSNQLIKGQQIRNWIKKARLDWNWSSFENLIFCKKIKFDYHWLLINSFPKPFQILPVLIPDAYQLKEKEKIALETLFKNWKIRVLGATGSPSFAPIQLIPSRPLHSLRSLESIQTLISFKTIKNQGIPVSVCSYFSKFDS